MLTPMLVQYLVGLCCVRRFPEAVDITLGDMVTDVAANKARDVDVTVTLQEGDGTVRAFKAYEVKREGDPLDVVAVEQLCMKLADMPSITHRAIVSSSGFTDGAVSKARTHGVELFVLKPWTEPMANQFPGFSSKGRPQDFLKLFQSNLLEWLSDRYVFLSVVGGPASFEWQSTTPLFDEAGLPHSEYPTMQEYSSAIILRSMSILWHLKPIVESVPTVEVDNESKADGAAARSHTHTLEVSSDGVFMKFENQPKLVDAVTISGRLQWQRRHPQPQFYMLEEQLSGTAFAGAILADWGAGDGRMFAMVFAPHSNAVNIKQFQLEKKHRNAIRLLKLQSQPPKVG